MYTWKDLKLATMQKMFSAEGSNIVNDESTADYLAGMPYAANEALSMIATAGKYFKKSLVIEKENDEIQGYNLIELTNGDFYDIEKIYYDTEASHTEIKGYTLEYGTLYLKRSGKYVIYYDAYAPEITEATEDDFVIDLPREVVVIIPLYMASQLYKDDDNGIATSYRNEFEVAFDRLCNNDNGNTNKFTSESGWI